MRAFLIAAALLAALLPGPASAAKSIELLNATVTTAVSGVISGSQESGVGAVRSLTLQADFTYGSGGTTAKAWVQTSFDGGVTWIDIASFAFTTATARRLYHLTNAAVTAIATPTDATLADNTAVNGFLGAHFRVKLTTTGTYAGGTTAKITAQIQ